MPALMTVTQASAVLGVEPKKLRQLIRDGHVNAVNVNPATARHRDARPSYRIDPDDLRAFQESHKLIPRHEVIRRRRVAQPGEVIEFIR